jgi:hypothetical protein
MRIGVIGGTGFLGQKTVATLASVPGAEVFVASRRGPVVVDVEQPRTFEPLRHANVIIDLSDGTRSRPDALAAFALEAGVTLLEATSDANAVRRLIEAHRTSTGPGRLVLGGGLFTGVSNLLARSVVDSAGPGATLEWAVSSNPYSGAGKGTIALLVEAAGRPAVSTVQGARTAQPLGRGPPVRLGGVMRPTLRISLAESEMLPFSTKATHIQSLFAPRPAFLALAMASLPTWLLKQSWFRWWLERYFSVIRRFLFRKVASGVDLMARATRDGQAVERHLSCHDGMEACAWALAAMAEGVALRPPPPGLSFIDDCMGLDALIRRVSELAGRSVFIEDGGHRLGGRPTSITR